MKVFKVDKDLDYKEVVATKITNNRIYFTDNNGRNTFESKISNYWGYIYFESEKKAIEYIIKNVESRIKSLNFRIGNLCVKGEEMHKLKKTLK